MVTHAAERLVENLNFISVGNASLVALPDERDYLHRQL